MKAALRERGIYELDGQKFVACLSKNPSNPGYALYAVDGWRTSLSPSRWADVDGNILDPFYRTGQTTADLADTGDFAY